MLDALRGTAVATTLFAASFVLHIVGGATDQDWLFAIAVVLIYLTATGFAALAALAAGRAWRGGDLVFIAWAAIGAFFTGGALWAANGRAFAWWEVPAALALEVAASGLVFLAARRAGFVAVRSAA